MPSKIRLIGFSFLLVSFLFISYLMFIIPNLAYAQSCGINSWAVTPGYAGPGTCDGSFGVNGTRYCSDWDRDHGTTTVCRQVGSGLPYPYFGCENVCPTCTRPYRDECTGCNTRTYYDSCNVAYRVEFSDSSCSSLCYPAPYAYPYPAPYAYPYPAP